MVSKEALQLAENLKKNGLATSQEEAIRKAEMMLGQSFASKPEVSTPDEFDITKENKPLKELMPKEPAGREQEPFQEPAAEKPATWKQEPLKEPVAEEKVNLEGKRMVQPEPHLEEVEPQGSQQQESQKPSKKKYAEEQIDLSEVFRAK